MIHVITQSFKRYWTEWEHMQVSLFKWDELRREENKSNFQMSKHKYNAYALGLVI